MTRSGLRLTRLTLLVTPTALAVGVLVGSAVLADDPPAQQPNANGCTCAGTVLHRSIPIQKLPSEVEGQNKIHVRLMPEKNQATGTLGSMSVLGKALYPDGVTLLVRLRHRKSTEAFMSAHAVVRESLFQAHFGPFTKTMPGGGLTVEVWFVSAQQSKEMQAKLISEHWYHSSPPCIHDTMNYYSLPYSMGGCDAEDQAENDEKAAMEAARKQLANARDVASLVFTATKSKEKSVADAGQALTKLGGDLDTVKTTFNAWAGTRQFLLFPRQAAKLKLLATLVQNEARASAAVAGVTVEGMTPDKGAQVLKQATEDANRVADELKGFVAETGSLDKQWDEAQASAAKAAPNPQTPAKPNK